MAVFYLRIYSRNSFDFIRSYSDFVITLSLYRRDNFSNLSKLSPPMQSPRHTNASTSATTHVNPKKIPNIDKTTIIVFSVPQMPRAFAIIIGIAKNATHTNATQNIMKKATITSNIFPPLVSLLIITIL